MIGKYLKVRTLPLYVLKEYGKTFSLAALVVLIVLFISFGFKEVMSQKGLDFANIFSIFPLLIGKVLPYGLPFAVACACTLTFGRLSGDNEISAMRCSGIHLNRIIVPILVLAFAASWLTFLVNDRMSPLLREQTMKIKEQVLDNITGHFASLGSPTITIPAGDEKIYLYVDNIVDKELKGVVIVRTKNGCVYQTIVAASGNLRYNKETKQLALSISRGSIKNIDPDHPKRINVTPITLSGGSPTIFPLEMEKFAQIDISDPEMHSNAELAAILRGLDRKIARKRAQGDNKTVERLDKDKKEAELVMYGRLASSMSCFFLAWLVVPLSIAIKRGHMVVAFMMGLLVVVGYLVMLIVGSKFLGMGGILPPIWAVWLPNILLTIFGAALLYKVVNK